MRWWRIDTREEAFDRIEHLQERIDSINNTVIRENAIGRPPIVANLDIPLEISKSTMDEIRYKEIQACWEEIAKLKEKWYE